MLAHEYAKLGAAQVLETLANLGEITHEDVVDLDQDWDCGVTTIELRDGSRLVISSIILQAVDHAYSRSCGCDSCHAGNLQLLGANG